MPSADDPPPAAAGSSGELGPATPSSRAPDTRAARRARREAAHHQAADPAALAPTHPLVILATLAVVLLVVVSAAAGQPQTGLALAFLGLVLAWGWPVLLGAPNPSTASAIIGAGAIAVAATAGLTRTEPLLQWVPVALAVSTIAGFFHQLLRRDGRARLTYGAATTISGLALATAGAPVATLPAYRHGGHYVLAAGAALALPALAELLGRWARWRRWMPVLAVLVGVGGALGVSAAVDGIPVAAAAILGGLVAGISHALRRVLVPLPGAGALQARMATGAASVLVVGVVVYLLTRLYAA